MLSGYTTSSASLGPPSQGHSGGVAPEAAGGQGEAREKMRRLIPAAIVLAIVAAGGAGAWYRWQQHLNALPPGVAQANGRQPSTTRPLSPSSAGSSRRLGATSTLARAATFARLMGSSAVGIGWKIMHCSVRERPVKSDGNCVARPSWATAERREVLLPL